MEALHSAGLPVLGISPLSSVTAHDGKVTRWDITPLQNALEKGLLPVIQGDVVFDEVRGGTILSTEDLFAHLAPILQPGRILLAGMEPGVWEDFPRREQIIRQITPGSLAQAIPSLGPSTGKDVTGGMQDKVIRMLNLIELDEDLQVWIFSGDPPGNLRSACSGINPGTSLNVDKPSNRD
jgi:isopentenyl phosphate kinase